MMRIKTLLVIMLSLFCFGAVTTAPVYAWTPFDSIDCSSGNSHGGKTADSAVCADKDKTANPIAGSNGLILKVVNLLAVMAGAVAVIIIILAGLKMVTSSGNADAVASSRRSIIYALVGLVIIVLSRTIIAFVLSKL